MVPAILALQRRTVLHLICAKVGSGDQTSALLDGFGQLLRHCAFVEVLGIRRDPGQLIQVLLPRCRIAFLKSLTAPEAEAKVALK